MIKNERQYAITRSKADSLRRALHEAPAPDERPDIDPRILNVHKAGIEEILAELTEDLQEYEQLQAGATSATSIREFADLPRALIRARISRSWTQEELAERVGMHSQQIQRYEATDYASASLATLGRIANALQVGIEGIVEPRENAGTLLSRAMAKVRAAGLSREFIERRLLGSPLADGGEEPGAATRRLSALSRALRLPLPSLLSQSSAGLGAESQVLFKLPSGYHQTNPLYLRYVETLAEAVAKARPIDGHRRSRIATSSRETHEQIRDEYGVISFSSVLDYVWSRGIPVVPLLDAAEFHAACFQASSGPVIFIKQRHRLAARWMFDLLHEVSHASESTTDEGWIALDDDHQVDGDEREQRANRFAGNVALAGKAETLAEAVVSRAAGRVDWLKIAVAGVAREENVDQGALANYIALRLSRQGLNWWGTAHNLQRGGEDPWGEARDKLLSRLRLELLENYELELLQLALEEEDE
ncbi:MAG: XRE family transcriptional regulator [Dehalococcoidia bacterium]